MKKFNVKFLREFEVEIEAESGGAASEIAASILTQFPAGSTKVLSVIAADYVETECAGCAVDPMNPHGKPRGPKPDPSGGSPQTPALPTAAPLVDQIAVAA